MGLIANFWKRLRTSPARVKRARRLFLEPLEGRQLLSMLVVTKTDPYSSQTPQQSYTPGSSTPLVYTLTFFNDPTLNPTNPADETGILFRDPIPAHTQSAGTVVISDPGGASGATANYVSQNNDIEGFI